MWRLIVLIALGVIATVVGCGKSQSPSPALVSDIGEAPSDATLDLPAISALEQFAAAREILTMYPDSLANSGRAPVINGKPIRLPRTSADAVQLCAQLLSQATQGGGRGLPEQERMEALQLMRHCDAVFSDDKVSELLATAEQLPDGPNGSVIVSPGALDKVSDGFGRSPAECFRMIEQGSGLDGAAMKIRLDLKYSTVLEAAFLATVGRRLDQARATIAATAQAARRKRIEARDPSPKLTALIFSVDEKIDLYDGRCVYFDKVWVSGDIDRRNDGFYRVAVRDERGEDYTGFGTEMLFVCEQELADQIRVEIAADERVKCCIFCDMYKVEPEKNTSLYVNGVKVSPSRARAEVYKIGFYNIAGNIFKTIPPSANASDEAPLKPPPMAPIARSSPGNENGSGTEDGDGNALPSTRPDSAGDEAKSQERARLQVNVETHQADIERLTRDLEAQQSGIKTLETRLARLNKSTQQTLRAKNAKKSAEQALKTAGTKATHIAEEIRRKKAQLNSFRSQLREVDDGN